MFSLRRSLLTIPLLYCAVSFSGPGFDNSLAASESITKVSAACKGCSHLLVLISRHAPVQLRMRDAKSDIRGLKKMPQCAVSANCR